MTKSLFLKGLAALLAGFVGASSIVERATGPFLTVVDNQTWVIGNELWNMTQQLTYGVKLFYKEHDCVGDAVGHYVSYSTSLLLQRHVHMNAPD